MTKQRSRWATSLPLLPIASAAEGPPPGGWVGGGSVPKTVTFLLVNPTVYGNQGKTVSRPGCQVIACVGDNQ